MQNLVAINDLCLFCSNKKRLTMFITLFIYKVTFTYVRCAGILFGCCIVICVKQDLTVYLFFGMREEVTLVFQPEYRVLLFVVSKILLFRDHMFKTSVHLLSNIFPCICPYTVLFIAIYQNWGSIMEPTSRKKSFSRFSTHVVLRLVKKLFWGDIY